MRALPAGERTDTFFNDVGDTITLSSTADSAYGPGGAGYGGETGCREGYVWPRDRTCCAPSLLRPRSAWTEVRIGY